MNKPLTGYPPTPISTLVFGAAMGTLWLGVVPLVSGLIVHLFGLRFMATLSGIAFMSHQVGSFLGAWGGWLHFQFIWQLRPGMETGCWYWPGRWVLSNDNEHRAV